MQTAYRRRCAIWNSARKSAVVDWRAVDETNPATRQRMIDDLRELITALDRRVPRLEATGEIDIASDAAKLRDKAVERIAELENPAS